MSELVAQEFLVVGVKVHDHEPRPAPGPARLQPVRGRDRRGSADLVDDYEIVGVAFDRGA